MKGNLTYHLSWLLPLVLFGLHQLLQRVLDVPLEWLDNYLDPFCAGALGLHLIAFERKLYFGQKHLTLVDILITTGVIIIASEIIFPYFSDRFVADWKDAIAITAGMVWYIVTATRYRTSDLLQ